MAPRELCISSLFERQIASLLSSHRHRRAAPRWIVRFHFSPYPLDASGESRRTRFEILQGLVRQLNGIDFASILVVLYPCLPVCRRALRKTCFANAYILPLWNQTYPSFISCTGTWKSRRKHKIWEVIASENERTCRALSEADIHKSLFLALQTIIYLTLLF